MRSRFAVLFFCLIGTLYAAAEVGTYPSEVYGDSLHKAWSMLLSRHVSADGMVNYRSFLKDRTVLEEYLAHLADNPPGEHGNKNERLAYYINLYNAATVKLILDHYPLKSIRDLRNPWGNKWIRVGRDTLSLDQIEHDILRKLQEPRVHFALNCASFSCPALRREAFSGNRLDEQLQAATAAFINDPNRNTITQDTLNLSRIFQWYAKDFGGEGALGRWIAPYTEASVNPEARITYKKYIWSLNEIR